MTDTERAELNRWLIKQGGQPFWTCERGHRVADNSLVCLVCLLGITS